MPLKHALPDGRLIRYVCCDMHCQLLTTPDPKQTNFEPITARHRSHDYAS